MVETSGIKAALSSDFYTCIQLTTPHFSGKPEECVDSEILYLNFLPATISKTCEQAQLPTGL